MVKALASFAAWQVVAQIISSSSLLLLILLVTDQEFADYGLALTVGSLVAANICIRIEQSVLAASLEDAQKLCVAAAACAIAFGAVTLGVSFALFERPGIIAAGVLYGVSFAVTAAVQNLKIRSGKSQQAGRLMAARTAVVAAFVLGGTALAPAQYRASLDFLLAVGAIAVLVLALGGLRQELISLRPSLTEIKLVVLRYKDVWSALVVQSLASSLSLSLPYFVIWSVYPASYAAAFLLADRIIRAPIALVSYSLRSHLTPTYRDSFILHGWLELRRLTSLLLIASLLGLVTLASVFIIANERLLEGRWSVLAATLVLLTPWAATSLSLAPASAFLTAHRKTSILARNQVLELGVKIAAAIVLITTSLPYLVAVAMLFVLPFLNNIIVMRYAFELNSHKRWLES